MKRCIKSWIKKKCHSADLNNVAQELNEYDELKYNFGEGIVNWIQLFYKDMESAVMNNGYLTSWFKPLRGVRQGCPLSPYLLILTVEILSNNILQDTNIKGIVIFGNEIKLTQFGDDTNLFCRDLDSVPF